LVALAPPADAQALQRLHVRSVVTSVEPQRVRLGDMLRLVLRVRVDERIARLDNVTLPDLGGFDVLGDERHCLPERHGTACSEALSLAPSVAGVRSIGPITLDAIDAKTGRPTRFGSNAVSVTVVDSQLASPAKALGSAVFGMLRLLAIALLVALAVIAAVLWFRRRKPAPAARVPSGALLATYAPRDEDARWRTTIEHLRARPSRARVDAVRAILRERVGARADETFADLAARGAHLEQPSAMEALRLIERAAFVDEAHLTRAVLDALPALESVAGMKRVGG